MGGLRVRSRGRVGKRGACGRHRSQWHEWFTVGRMGRMEERGRGLELLVDPARCWDKIGLPVGAPGG